VFDADQPRRALRQGRFGARARPRRAPPEISDEAGRRQVGAHDRGNGAQRGRRPLLAIRKESGPDATYWVGSSKHSNEQAYLFRKFVSFWGTNNCDHQARICHSTTVAGVANTWGYGAMTNSYNDMQNAKAIAVHRLERGRSAPGVDAAHPARQGKRRKMASSIRASRAPPPRPTTSYAHPLRHRHSLHLGHAATTSSRTAGKTRSTSRTASMAWTRSAKK
jgi:hypothetical protein